jgi:UDP-N-acetylglucosamine acyltransferase
MKQHPTAVIHKATRLGEGVAAGPYAVIEDGVEIGEGSVIREHAVIRSGTVLGKGCVVDAHAVIGGLPQDLSFNPKTPSGVRVGDHVTFREGVTINRATVEGGFTEIGNHCYLMAESHVGHDCRIGRHVVLANAVLLAGKVSVGDRTFVGGSAAIHQYCRIGESAMVGGLARVSQDMPPYCIMAERNELVGLNLIGLQRSGVARETIRELKKLYQMVFGFEGRPRILAEGALRDGMAQSEEGRRFLEFVAMESKKGVMRPRKGGD